MGSVAAQCLTYGKHDAKHTLSASIVDGCRQHKYEHGERVLVSLGLHAVQAHLPGVA